MGSGVANRRLARTARYLESPDRAARGRDQSEGCELDRCCRCAARALHAVAQSRCVPIPEGAAMSEVAAARPAFSWKFWRAQPMKGTGIGFVLFLRILYGIFYLGASINKVQRKQHVQRLPAADVPEAARAARSEHPGRDVPARLHHSELPVHRLVHHARRDCRGDRAAVRPLHPLGGPAGAVDHRSISASAAITTRR